MKVVVTYTLTLDVPAPKQGEELPTSVVHTAADIAVLGNPQLLVFADWEPAAEVA